MSNYNKKMKKRTRKMHNTIKGAGIFIENAENSEESFRMFLQNSTFKIIGKGSNGSIYLATLNAGIVSPYKSMNPFNFNEPVNTIIIKISYIEENVDVVFDTETINEKDFEDEINIQTDISMKTMEYLQPICPSVVYSNITNDPIYIENIFAELNSITSLRNIINGGLKYGIIGMEFADGYKTLNNLVPAIHDIANLFIGSTPREIDYICMAYYIIIELAIKTGYTHSDFHAGNILIHPTDTNYFSITQGSVVIIDFGWAEKLSHRNKMEIKELYKSRQYVEIFNVLCNIPRKDDYDLKDPTFSGFDYVCKIPVPSPYIDIINRRIDELINEKEEKTNEIIELFNSKPIEERNLYPLLPLSKRMKLKVYNGIQEKKLNIITIDEIVVSVGLTEPYIRDSMIYIYRIVKHEKKHLSLFYTACYIYVYLNTKYNSIINDSNNILYATISLFYAKVFSKLDINYLYTNRFRAYINSTKDELIIGINTYYNELNNCKIITIFNFISEILTLKTLTEMVDELLVLDDKYTDPKEYVNRVYPKVQAPTVNSPYKFPFQSTELTPPPVRASNDGHALARALALTPAGALIRKIFFPDAFPKDLKEAKVLVQKFVSKRRQIAAEEQMEEKIKEVVKNSVQNSETSVDTGDFKAEMNNEGNIDIIRNGKKIGTYNRNGNKITSYDINGNKITSV